jgi:CheY-like chemotaxis protein
MDHRAIDVGWRKVMPRVCIVDGKRHIRKFLEEALEQLGFTTCECTTERGARWTGARPRYRGVASHDALISALFEKQMEQCNA